MKKLFCCIILLFPSLLLSSCSIGGHTYSPLSAVYFGSAMVSLLLLFGYIIVDRKRDPLFVLLFSSVTVINIGYSLLSVSPTLLLALNANRIAYLGSVLLTPTMLLIILNATGNKFSKRLPIILFSLSVLIFAVAASPGILDIYYKSVDIETVQGVTTLVKEYGPLHPLFLVYLLGYFTAMVWIIIRAAVKRTVDSTSHAVVLAIAVLVNIGVWLIEQLSDIEFEFLSVSYIISELFLVGIHLIMRENQRLKALVNTPQPTPSAVSVDADISEEAIQTFEQGLSLLTNTERRIYEAYIKGQGTKDILAELSIKENTLKFHNKNLYGKLGVSSRKQLIAIASALNRKS